MDQLGRPTPPASRWAFARRRMLSVRASLILVLACGVVFWLGLLATRWVHYSDMARSNEATALRAGREEREARQRVALLKQSIADDEAALVLASRSPGVLIDDAEEDSLHVFELKMRISLNQEQMLRNVQFVDGLAQVRMKKEALARRYAAAAGRPWRSLRSDEAEN